MNNLILVINKEKGFTSRDVVNKLTKILNNKKIGHTGTLDPIATGVLVCLTGKYTKLVNIITSLEKEYIATIKLGIETDTFDIEGNVINTSNVRKLSKLEIENILNSFVGEYIQEIPIYSAVHVNGKRLYEYARNNEEVTLPKRIVNIYKIELLSYENNEIRFKVLVSKGTYIRSLIQDICKELDVIGVMNELIRTKQGIFDIKNAYSLEDISNNNYKSCKLEDVINLRVVNINNDSLYKLIKNGNKINDEYDGYVLYKKDNIDIALYNFDKSKGRLIILF